VIYAAERASAAARSPLKVGQREFRLRHQSPHPIALSIAALAGLTREAAARVAGFPGVLRFDPERLRDRARLDAGMADAKRNGEFVFAHGIAG